MVFEEEMQRTGRQVGAEVRVSDRAIGETKAMIVGVENSKLMQVNKMRDRYTSKWMQTDR